MSSATTPGKERVFEQDEVGKIPKPFLLRRFHSLLGLWFTIYLIEHLLVNSQAALFFQDNASAFIAAVNRIHSIPYLRTVEIVFLAAPFLFHGIWGIYYSLSAKPNSYETDGSIPSLPQYRRNNAYSWQRITAWLLLFGIAVHVFHMRFLNYPISAIRENTPSYLVRIDYDKGLPLVAEKLSATIYDTKQLQEMGEQLFQKERKLSEYAQKNDVAKENYPADETYMRLINQIEEERNWLQEAAKKKLKPGQLLASVPTPGVAFFLVVRQTFKDPLLVILYSMLVIAAAFHGFNGLWTFCIKWGITLTRRSQKRMRTISTVLMAIVIFLGLLSAWGTFWSTQIEESQGESVWQNNEKK